MSTITSKQQQAVAIRQTDWTQSVTFSQFDPAQGTLQGIDVGLTADVYGNLSIVSGEAAPSTVTVSLPSTVWATGPGNLALGTVALDPSASATLAADAGTNLSGIMATGTSATSLQAGAGTIDLSPYVGTGTVPFGIDANVGLHVDGPANIAVTSHASADATVNLQYDYSPPPSTGQGGSGSYAGGVFLSDVTWLGSGTIENTITTAPQVFAFADSTTGWQQSLAVKQFDPSLGSLLAVNVVLSGDILASVSAENLDAAAGNIQTTQTAAFALELPGTTEATTASVSDSMALGGYDGALAFAGTSGRIDQGLTQTTTLSAQLSDSNDLSAFTGQSIISVPLSVLGTSSLDGPANLLASLTAQGGGKVSVSYTYSTPTASVSPAASTTITQPTTIAAGNTLTTTGLAISDSAGNGALTVTGTGADVTNTGTFVVGAGGFGSMLVVNTGVVQTSGGLTAIAGATGTDGSNVSVNGTGSSWQISGTFDVGQAAAGSMSISAGGSVSAAQTDIGVQTGAAGIVSVVGNGSTFAAGSSLVVGDAASAELSILGGAEVSATNADVGLNATGTGNIDIEGTGSELSLSGDLNLGDAGTGVLTLGNNTTLQVAGNLNIGANGVLNQFGGVIDPSVVNNTGRAGGKGSISASVSIANSGTLFAASGTETLSAPTITGTGALEIDSKGDLAVNVGSVVTTQTVSFTDGTGVLTIGTLGGFSATIGDLIAGDSIVVKGTSIASLSFDTSTHVLTLFDPSQAQAGVLQFGTSVVDQSLISVNGLTPCFVAGTRISTERGEVAVEKLQVGDRVQVVLGGHAEPVVWLGHRTVDCARHPEPPKVWPVCVAAHAFGPGRPSHDLWLSPDHAIYIGDVLIPVKYLINGSSIAQVPMDEVTYYHVELPQHSVLLAEGLPAESYLDTGDRANFANGNGPVALHPDFATRAWDAAACAPLVVTGAGLDAARTWVNAASPAALASRESRQAVA